MQKENITWITGVSSGIGRETALEFVRNGLKVAATSRNPGKAAEGMNNLFELPLNIIKCDIGSNQDVCTAYNDISVLGNVDCLINNAGITSFNLAEENSIAEIENIIRINLLGAIYCIKAVLPGMIERGRGTIINILSVAAEQVFKGSTAYAASKAGLMAYSNALREEVRKYNIRIVNVLPGATNTPIWSREMRDAYGTNMMTPSKVAKVILNLYNEESNHEIEKIVLKPIMGDL